MFLPDQAEGAKPQRRLLPVFRAMDLLPVLLSVTGCVSPLINTHAHTFHNTLIRGLHHSNCPLTLRTDIFHHLVSFLSFLPFPLHSSLSYPPLTKQHLTLSICFFNPVLLPYFPLLEHSMVSPVWPHSLLQASLKPFPFSVQKSAIVSCLLQTWREGRLSNKHTRVTQSCPANPLKGCVSPCCSSFHP